MARIEQLGLTDGCMVRKHHAAVLNKKLLPALSLVLSVIAHTAVVSLLWETRASVASPPLQVMLLQEAEQHTGSKVSESGTAADGADDAIQEGMSALASRDASVPEDESKEPSKEQSEEFIPLDSAKTRDDSPAYVNSDQVNVKPVLLVDVPPTLAGQIVRDLSSVVLNLLINEHGKVDRVIVEDESLPETTRQTLVDGFSKVQFTPARMQERPVKVRLRIEVSVGGEAIVQ